MFSYGSGAEGEFYTGIVQPHFLDYTNDVQAMLQKRHQVSIAEYEDMFNHQLGMDEQDVEFDLGNDHAPFVLAGQQNHQRIYKQQ